MSRYVWLSWKDIKHPEAGGAELVQHNICKRLATDGHQVTVITSRPKGAKPTEKIDDYTIVRKGSRYTVYWHAWRTYRKRYAKTCDQLIEEVNTIPFFSKFYKAGAQHTMLFHQLARQIWFYQYFFPLNVVGYLIEPLYLRLARSNTVIAMSSSTRQDLLKHGYKKSDVSVISEGIVLRPVKSLSDITKTTHPSLLAYGSIRPMKRTLHAVKAFELAKAHIPNLTLTLAGDDSGKYAAKVKKYVTNSPYSKDITVLGRVSAQNTPALLQKHHFILSTAVKEGWGLTITEAASQGTPAIAYNVDGQRDAAALGKTGVLVEPTIEALAQAIKSSLSPKFEYSQLQIAAWQASKKITFEQTYADFLLAINK